MRETVVVWVGRFSQRGGYASATRSYLDALHSAGLKVIAVDLNMNDVVGPSCGVALNIRKTRDYVEITTQDDRTHLVAIVHDTPDKARRVTVGGKAIHVGLTVFETESFPQQWFEPMIDLDELWTASDWNRDTFVSGGVPDFMIRVIPHCLDCSLYSSSTPRMTLPGVKNFKFLSVVSNYNRKNIGQLLTSYFSSFTSEDEVSLVLKLPQRTSEADIETYLKRAVEPFFEFDDPRLPHVRLIPAGLSDEAMRQLYASCDVYVSMERGKGWDLCAMEAMALGKPTIGIDWSGSTQFMTEDNSLLIKPLPGTVYIESDQVSNHSLYTAHKWAAVDDKTARDVLRRSFEDHELRARVGEEAARSIRAGFDIKVVGKQIRERLEAYESSDFVSNDAARVTLHRDRPLPVRQPQQRGKRKPPARKPAGDNGVIDLTDNEINLLAHLRRTRAVSVFRPSDKHRSMQEMMDFYHEVKKTLPRGSRVHRALEDFAIVPRENRLAKLVAWNRLARLETSLYNPAVVEAPRAEPESEEIAQLSRPFNSKKEQLEDWLKERRQLVGRHGPAPLTEGQLSRLEAVRDRYYGKRVIIMGNGPSLKHVNFEHLKYEYTFAANRIYLAYDKTDWRPDFYTCLDWRVTPDNYEDINALSGSTFFFPQRFKGLLRDGDDVCWYFSRNAGRAALERFEPDATLGVRGGGTIAVAAIQLAWFLGFRDICLIGVDANYSIPKSVIQSGPDRFGTGVRINLESTKDDDHNHFDPRYFGRGAKWHDPNVDEMKRGFRACRKGIEVLGGRIRNATHGGMLEVFDRVALDEVLADRTGAKVPEPIPGLSPSDPPEIKTVAQRSESVSTTS